MAEPTLENLLELSDADFDKLLSTHGKFKQRSHDTHLTVHQPELQQLIEQLTLASKSSTSPTSSYLTSEINHLPYVLLGHSFLERFKDPDSGAHTSIGQLPRSQCFNAGVGGDRIANVAYRCGQLSLLRALKTLRPGVWVVCVGTNDLRPRKGLAPGSADTLRMLLIGVLRTAPEGRVVVCAITSRTDVADELVEAGNEELRKVVVDLQRQLEDLGFGTERLWWMARLSRWTKEQHLVDHVRYTQDGYEVWVEELWPEMQRAKALGPGKSVMTM